MGGYGQGPLMVAAREGGHLKGPVPRPPSGGAAVGSNPLLLLAPELGSEVRDGAKALGFSGSRYDFVFAKRSEESRAREKL